MGFSPAYRLWVHGLGKLRRRRYAAYLRSLRRVVHLTDPKASQKRARVNSEVWNEERGMSELTYFFGLNEKSFKRMIGRAIQSRGPIRVLDVGCGNGLFLNWLKENFHSSVATTGIGIKHKPSLKGVDVFRTTPIERFLQRAHFDFIFSVEGAVYSANPALALENVYHSLRVGGTAYLNLGRAGWDFRHGIMRAIRKQTGASVRMVGPVTFVITRRLESPVDLHMFYPKKSDPYATLNRSIRTHGALSQRKK